MLTHTAQESLKIHFLPYSFYRMGDDVRQGLSTFPKSLPPQYFYDEKGSQLFEKICDLAEYYPTRTETAILSDYIAEIATITGVCELVELGSGSSRKTRLILDAYQEMSEQGQYVPIDVSGEMLKSSALQLQKEYPTLSLNAFVGTYEQGINALQPTDYPTRMIFFLGSSIGNFNPRECDQFLSEIATVLAKGEYFLLGIDLQKRIDILEAAYNDSLGVTAAFNLNMLAHLNDRFQGNFNLDLYRHQALYNTVDHQIEMYLISQADQTVHLAELDLTVSLAKSEKILTEISRKFNREAMQSLLASKGLKTIKTFTGKQQWFGLILCQKIA